MSSIDDVKAEMHEVAPKAMITSTTIWSIVGLLATYFMSHPEMFTTWIPSNIYQTIVAILAIFFGGTAIKSRVTAVAPISGVIVPNDKKPMVFVKAP